MRSISYNYCSYINACQQMSGSGRLSEPFLEIGHWTFQKSQIFKYMPHLRLLRPQIFNIDVVRFHFNRNPFGDF